MVRALALFGTATALAAFDLAHKAVAGGGNLHARSAGYALVVIVLVTVWVVAILATRMLSLAFSGGVVAGGAVGNLVSVAMWQGVPNPMVVEPIAFNLADVFVVVGFLLVAAVTLAVAARDFERLRTPVSLR